MLNISANETKNTQVPVAAPTERLLEETHNLNREFARCNEKWRADA